MRDARSLSLCFDFTIQIGNQDGKVKQNPLVELEKQFLAGSLSKAAYIEQMYAVHETLFAYSEFIRSRNAEKITITGAIAYGHLGRAVVVRHNHLDWGCQRRLGHQYC